MAFAELQAQFLEHLVKNRGRSNLTAEAYAQALQRLVSYASDRDPLELTRDDLELFLGAWLHKHGIERRGRRRYVAAVRMFYRWATAAKKIPHNPAADLSYPKVGTKLPRVITLENAEKLMWSPDFNTFEGVRDAAILSMLAGAGLRASGVSQLNEGDLLHDNVDGKQRILVRVREKGEKERLVPLPAEADLLLRMYLDHPICKAIDRHLEDGDRVLFVNLKNRNVPSHEYHGERRRMSRKGVYLIVRRYGEAAGIPVEQLHPHAMRHLYGTELAENGVDIIVRQRLMGHADPKSSEIYDHTAMRRLVRVVDQANPLSKMRTPVTELLAKLAPKPLEPKK